MKRAYVCIAVLGAVLGIVGCGSDDAGGDKGGSCITTNPAQCYQVTSPADYDLKTECTAFGGGTWSKDPCNAANYARKCTDDSVEVDGVPATYVYFFPEGSTEDCFGDEEPL